MPVLFLWKGVVRKNIRFFDMFSGIGGFREGLNRAGGFSCVGHCEIDQYADRSYRAIFNTEGEWFCNDATKIQPEELPEFDLLCGGFPCQAFSVAGKRRGFEDARGTLFFEIARLVKARRPPYLLLENVPGLLSHNKGATFNTILYTLYELGYHVEWQVLNSKDFGVPQSRKRVYLIGYLDERCAGKILPFTGANEKALVQILPGCQGSRVYSKDGLSCTITSTAGGMGGKTGLYDMGMPIKENTKKGYKMAYEGDSVDIGYPGVNARGGRVGHQIAHTVTPRGLQGTVHIIRHGNTSDEDFAIAEDMEDKAEIHDIGLPIKENTKKGYKMAYEGDSIDLGYAGMNTRRGRVGRQIAHTLTTGSTQGTVHFVDLDSRLRVTEVARCITTRQNSLSDKHLGERSGALEEERPRAVLTPERENVRQQGRRMKAPEEEMFTLTAQDRHGVCYEGRIRRLTPRECLRLQGYYEEQIDKILELNSDAQAYKQAGNGVTVNVIEAIGRRLYQVHSGIHVLQ